MAEAGIATDPPPEPAVRFKQSPVRLHPSEQRTVSLLFDPERIEPGTAIEVVADAGLALRLSVHDVPLPGARGWSRGSGTLRARVTVEPGARLSVLAQAGEHSAELDVLIVRHRTSGWVREIARKDEDAGHRGAIRPRVRRRHRLRRPPRVPRACPRGAPGRPLQASSARVPALPHARSRGGRQRGIRVGGGTRRRAQACRRAPFRPRRVRTRRARRGPDPASPIPRATHARVPRARGLRRRRADGTAAGRGAAPDGPRRPAPRLADA